MNWWQQKDFQYENELLTHRPIRVLMSSSEEKTYLTVHKLVVNTVVKSISSWVWRIVFRSNWAFCLGSMPIGSKLRLERCECIKNTCYHPWWQPAHLPASNSIIFFSIWRPKMGRNHFSFIFFRKMIIGISGRFLAK